MIKMRIVRTASRIANLTNFLIKAKIIITTTIKIPTATTVGIPARYDKTIAIISQLTLKVKVIMPVISILEFNGLKRH